MSIKRYFLYINTLKYLKGSQFYHRGLFTFKKKILFKTVVWKKINKKNNYRYINSIEKIYPLVFNLGEIDSSTNIKDLENNKKMLTNKEFYFLNKREVFNDEIGWANPNLSQLWRYNLHYFDYFRRLIEIEFINPDISNYDLLKFYVTSWITNNEEIGLGDGWHPYTISLRLVNWIFAYSAFHQYLKDDDKFNKYFLNSIILQSNFLLNNREHDVVGNHLFENLKTLIIIGMFLHNSKIGNKCLKIGENEMTIQLSEQFLKDGGHFELSAMYHSILLKGLTELIYVYKNLGNEIPPTFIETQLKALKYLNNITHPDEEIPLFNDAAFGIADSPSYIKEYILRSEEKTSSLSLFDQLISGFDNHISPIEVEYEPKVFYAKESGYLRTEDKTIFSIIDVGIPCPDYLPAHAHADIFSYEISVNKKRFIVDTGTYEYSGIKRDYDRSTRAHNTLTINQENQSEVWGSFRVARRAKPNIISYEKNSDYVEIFASHNGYLKKFGALHYRKYIHVFNHAVIVLDFVNSNESIESYIHLEPSSVVSLNGENIEFTNENFSIKPINADFFIEDSVYHQEFGIEKASKKIVVKPRALGTFGYYYTYGNKNIYQSDKNISINTKEKNFNFDLDWGISK